MKTNYIIGIILSVLSLAGTTNAQCFEETSGGVIAIEAEGFTSQQKTNKREWFVIGNGGNTPKPDPDGSHAGGASGGKYIEALPDTRVTHDDPIVVGTNFTDKPGEVAVLNYRVNFKTTGKYFVWVRLYSSGSEDNGVHVGIDDTWPASGKKMQWCDGKRSWTWESKQRTNANHCGVERQIFINVPTVGEHTFQLSMREDGVEIDKIVLSKSYTKPSGKGPSAKKGSCGGNNNTCNIPNVTNKSSIAVVADGNSPDPDDIGATAASLALLKAFGVEKDLVYYSHSCDTDPFKGSRHNISVQRERERQQIMQTSAEGTASRWGGFNGITFYNCRTQRKLATDKLTDAINAATSAKPLAIILAGEPDLIYDAVKAANSNKRKFVTIVSHHVANEESADEPGKNISDLKKDFSAVTVTRIPDQNVLLKKPLNTWHWARDHKDSRIEWLWKQGKIAEEDGVVRFQDGQFDVSDAGMVYYQITGDKNPDVGKFRKALECYVDNNTPPSNNAPIVRITSPANNATFEVGQEITLSANASDPDGNLEKVNFKINDDFYKTVSVRPFEYSFTPTEPGSYKIAALAIDKENAKTEVFVNITVVKSNADPLVEMISPSNNATYELGDEINISAGASDPDGNLDKVNFFINDEIVLSDAARPFETTFTPTAIGTYTIIARAIDKENAKTDASVTITVVEKNIAPTASFTTPTNNILEEGYSELIVTVDASDPNGDKLTVVLKINGEEIRTESVAPYEWGHAGSPAPLETVGLAVGDHMFEAIVTDVKGLVTTISKTITVDKVTGSTSDLDRNELTVFPNPSKSGVFKLSEDSEWEVYNLSGINLLSGNNNQVDLSSEPKGMYILKINGKVIQLLHH